MPDPEVAAYERVRKYVDVDLVRLTPRRRDREGKVASALRFNALLGDPQRCCPAIQVAGTSGKGSVCALIAGALHAAGLRTALHVSPYLQVFTEKTWIAGRYLNAEDLQAACEVVRPVAEQFRGDPDCPASVHGMTSLALSYEAFRATGCDVMVCETGCGGRFDLVQGLDLALCVIGDLALDHVKALGPTLNDIAWHKAGILRAGVPAVAIRGPGVDVIEREANSVGAPLTLVEPPAGASFHERNAALASAALDRLRQDGWAIERLAKGSRLRLPGRAEIMQTEPRVILDGAHNAHKLRALLAEVCRSTTEPTPTVVLAVSGQRAPRDLLVELLPYRPRVIATGLDLYGKASVPADALAAAARALGLEAVAVPVPEAALEVALREPAPSGVLVTGSIYLVGRLRSRWIPWQEVLRSGSSWPSEAIKPV